MAIELQEYVGATAIEVTAPLSKISLQEGYTQTYIDENSLMVDIEAIHSIVTRNNTLYTPQCIKDSIPYWTAPYERPVIMHHNERDGVIIGRVKSANYIENSERSGTAALELVVNIGDEEGKKGIKNGTLATVSIGAIAHDIKCSICGQNLVEEGLCEHDKGEIYNGKKCYWIVNKIEPKEVSYVIVPSDIYAHNTRVYDAVKKNRNNEVKESMENIFADLILESGLANALTESKKEEVKEGAQINEEVKPDAKVEKSEIKEEPKAEEGEKEGESEVKEEPKKEEKESKEEEPKEKEEAKSEEKENKEQDEAKEDDKEVKKEKEEEKKEEEDKEPKEDKSKELEEENKALKKQIADLEAKVEKLTRAVENEKTLKESAEAELLSFRTAKKKSLVETINSLRTQLSLPQENVETLIESSEESLNLTIKSLEEFVQVQKKTLSGLSIIESPVAVSEEKDNTSVEKKVDTNVKESTNDSNKNFESDLLNLMSTFF